MNRLIRRSWVINLDRREDRCIEFVERTNQHKLVFPNLERFPAIDGKALFDIVPLQLENDHLLAYLKHMLTEQRWTHDWTQTDGEFREGEIGVLLSHYAIYMKILDDTTLLDNEWFLIMEDDVFWNDNVVEEWKRVSTTLASRNDIDLVWIAGRNHPHYVPPDKDCKDVYERITENLYLRHRMNPQERVGWFRQATAYLLTKRGVRQVVEHLHQRSRIAPLDHCLIEANVKQYDWFPHLGYSPLNYKTDIQHGGFITPYHVCRLILFNQYHRLLHHR